MRAVVHEVISRKIDRFGVRWDLELESDAAGIEYRTIKNLSHSQALDLSRKDMSISGNATAPDLRRESVIRKVQNPQANTTLSFVEAAIYFEVSPRTIYRWLLEGDLRRGHAADQLRSNRFCNCKRNVPRDVGGGEYA